MNGLSAATNPVQSQTAHTTAAKMRARDPPNQATLQCCASADAEEHRALNCDSEMLPHRGLAFQYLIGRAHVFGLSTSDCNFIGRRF
jgi:hypothetical protein